MIVSLRCDCAFFLEKLEIIMCRLWRPECVARQHVHLETMENTTESREEPCKTWNRQKHS